MGSAPVIPREGNKRPRAFVQIARAKKLLMRTERFESIVKEEYSRYLKEHGGLAPDVYQLKLRVNPRLEYSEAYITEHFNWLIVEALTNRSPYYRMDGAFLVPK